MQLGGNCENKMLLISSSTTIHQWPQDHQVDDQKGLMASRVMEKPINQDQIQSQNQQQVALKCPRCDSSNTKFCYYNNYSLSQPRHFCKACKRYWTRGGTLRNVPVGGGCRKNKRVNIKRSSSAIDAHAPTSSSSPSPNPSSNPSLVNPLFYGLSSNPNSHELTTLSSYPNFNSRVSSVENVSHHGLDLQSQLNALGLGFDPNKQIQDVGSGVTSANIPFLSSYSLFGSSTYPTMASLLASKNTTSFQGLVPYEDLQQMPIRNIGELKMEQGGQKRLDWNQIDHQVSQTDPSLYWNNTNNATSFGGPNWLDPSLNGSSAPSLI